MKKYWRAFWFLVRLRESALESIEQYAADLHYADKYEQENTEYIQSQMNECRFWKIGMANWEAEMKFRREVQRSDDVQDS